MPSIYFNWEQLELIKSFLESEIEFEEDRLKENEEDYKELEQEIIRVLIIRNKEKLINLNKMVVKILKKLKKD